MNFRSLQKPRELIRKNTIGLRATTDLRGQQNSIFTDLGAIKYKDDNELKEEPPSLRIRPVFSNNFTINPQKMEGNASLKPPLPTSNKFDEKERGGSGVVIQRSSSSSSNRDELDQERVKLSFHNDIN